MKPIIAAPLVAVVLAGAGAGAYFAVAGAGSGEEAPPAQPTSTPTPTEATPTPTAAPPPTPEATPTPTPTPEGGQAPKGCLPTELAYVDPDGRFAFCYPADMQLTTVDAGDGTIAAHVAHPSNQLDNRITVSFGIRVEPYARCGMDSMDIVANERIQDLAFAGGSVQACFSDHYESTQPDVLRRKTIDFAVSPQEGKPVIVFASYSGPNFQRGGIPLEDIVMRILDSAVIY